MAPRIPPPQYIYEVINGVIYDLNHAPDPTDEQILVIGTVPSSLAALQPRVTGNLILRYGIPYNSPSTDVLVPGLFVSERGYPLIGREAWDFMTEKFQLYPRAEIVGFRLNGRAGQVFLRELDWGATIRVLVYESTEHRVPVAIPTSMFVAEDAGSLPILLSKYRLPAPTL